MVDNSLLGTKVSDEISGFTGIVNTVGDHLTGCSRIGVRPSDSEDPSQRGKEEFFYEEQLDVVDDDTKWADNAENAITDVEFGLGDKVKDTVTGMEGIIVVLNFSVFNCPSAGVQPITSDPHENPEAAWFDTPRLEKTGDGVREEFADLQTATTEQTGAVADAPNDRSSFTADRL